MSYDKHHVDLLTPQEGYDLCYKEYHKYWTHLDSFGKVDFQRYIARDKKNINIIDLGAGDGRLYQSLNQISHSKYVACDISSKLLSQHQGNVDKVVCDLNLLLPFDDQTFDLAVGFFVIEYIDNLDKFFDQVYRILKNNGLFIIGYFVQRREFVWNIDNHKFKIPINKYKIEDIESALKNSFFDIFINPVIEKSITTGYIIVCEKK